MGPPPAENGAPSKIVRAVFVKWLRPCLCVRMRLRGSSTSIRPLFGYPSVGFHLSFEIFKKQMSLSIATSTIIRCSPMSTLTTLFENIKEIKHGIYAIPSGLTALHQQQYISVFSDLGSEMNLSWDLNRVRKVAKFIPYLQNHVFVLMRICTLQ